jgi:hypothetical protein
MNMFLNEKKMSLLMLILLKNIFIKVFNQIKHFYFLLFYEMNLIAFNNLFFKIYNFKIDKDNGLYNLSFYPSFI